MSTEAPGVEVESSAARALKAHPSRTRKQARRRHSVVGWLFVAPFGIVFLVFLVAPLAYAFYLSLFRTQLIGGTSFVWFQNYEKAFADPSFQSGVKFVLVFSLVLIPLQMFVSLVMALVLDAVVTKFTRFARLMIFLPYSIPVVIGTIMWGFLYSKNFGPMAEIWGLFGATPPDLLSKDLIFFGLLNLVTWQWAGYYMIIIFAALQGIDPTLYEAARIDGASAFQITLRVKVPLITNSLAAHPRFRTHRNAPVLHRTEGVAVPRCRLHRAGLHAEPVRVPTSVCARQRQLRIGDLLRARVRGVRMCLPVPILHT